MRPLLKPALRRVWRDAATLQIGIDPGSAVVIGGLRPPEARLVEQLDGSGDLAATLARARLAGIDEQRARRLLALLDRTGVLDDGAAEHRPLAAMGQEERERLAPDLASLTLTCAGAASAVAALSRRRSSAVLVVGAGRVGATVASVLAAAGVGHVLLDDPAPARRSDAAPAGLPAELTGGSRAAGAGAGVRRAASSTRSELPAGQTEPDVAVLAPVGRLDPAIPGRLLRAAVPHLVVQVRETSGTVGPLVLPGRSSCLHCADLHRADRDPGWPRVAAQLSAAPPPALTAPCDIALATLVAAQAALEVLAMLDGTGPATIDGTLETRLPGGTTRRRTWLPHPACGCRWLERDGVREADWT